MSTGSTSRAELLRRRLSGVVKPAADSLIAPVARGGPLPLSFAQRRMWVLDQIQPGTEYLMPLRLRLRGSLDLDALRRALDAIVARHEVLRSRYVNVGGEPMQVVDEPGPMPLRVRDLDGEALDDAVAAADVPFDLATEWPIRALLLRASDEDATLLITAQHIASDGWSESILLSELDALYGAFTAGRENPLPPLPVQYADFAAWQRDQLSGERLDRQLDFWRRALDGLTPLALPTDRPRGPVREIAGRSHRFTVPAELAVPLTALGRRHGATPYMVFLAAFQILLGRYARQDDVVVGTPVAGRSRAETHNLVGLFVNTVALRTDLSGDPSFLDLLARVRETALSAFDHQDTPFERVVDALAPQRDPSRNPIFQVTFQLAAAGRTETASLPVEQEDAGWSVAKFDLSLALATEDDGAVNGEVSYAAALFDAGTVERMGGHFLRLLGQIAQDPHASIGSFDLLTPGERAHLLDERAGTGESFPTQHGLPEAFEEQVRRTPDAVAVTFRGQHLTYAQLNVRANRLAHHLRARGAGPDTLVGISLDRSIELVVAILGVLKSGAGYLPLDPGQPADRLAFIAEDAGCDLVVGRDDRVPGTPVAVDAEGREDDPEPLARPDDVAYVIYTSGSTGRPKGVPVTHANVLRLMRGCAADFGFGPDDVWTLFHSYAFDFSVWELWGALLHGGRLVVVPFEVSRSPQDFLELLRDERVTVLNQTPSAFRGLVEAVAVADLAPADLALRTVVFGGEALDVAELAPWFERFGDREPVLVNMYGITETTVHVTYRPIRAGEVGVRSPIGRPLRDLRLYVLDDAGHPCPVGVPGQLFVSGPGLARGYLNRPGLTAERFGPDPHSPVPGARRYRTGDLARFTAAGELEFLGRVDDQVKIRGHRIEPGEIEAAITGHQDVDASVVVAHGAPDKRLVAYYAPAALAAADLRDHLGATLPAYMVPAIYVPLDALPVTANGKVDLAALPDPDTARADLAEHVAPRSPVEQIIAETWSEVLGVERVGVHDNFFALGGDSIRAIKVVGALRPRGVDLTVQNLLVHQDIDGLARFHDGATPGQGSTEEQRVAPFALIDPAERAALPDDVVDAYPVSMVQAAMVYQMLADTDDSPYHNITLFPFADDAPFDLAALRTAAANLGRRHEILRTSFDLTDHARPLQLVHRTGAVEVGYDDLRDRTAAEAKAEIERFTAWVRANPFDPARAPMIRFHVHQTGDTRWTFSFIECHAVLDGWSHHSLIQEVMAEYRALREHREPPAEPEHDVRYADFIALEVRSLASRADREFWADRIGRFDRAELPEAWASSDPDEQPFLHRVSFRDIEPGLRRLAESAGVPFKSVLFAAHLKVVSVLNGGSRFHTGLVCNGRLETAGGEAVRGMHLNTVPVGVDLTGATWIDLVREVFAEEVAIWPHRRFPLPEMQRSWGQGRPLVDIAFTYLDFHVLDSSRIESDGVVDVSPNEFGMDVWTFPGQFHISCLPSRISRSNGPRVAAMYRRVLESMAADPAGDAHAGVLGADETALLASFADGPSVEYPDRCLHELFEEQVERTPDAVALRCLAADGSVDAEIGYADLNSRANRLARRLRGLGVAQESRVGVLLRRGPDLVVSLLAVLKAGAAYLPLDPAHPAARLSGLVRETGAEVVLTQPDLAHLLEDSGTHLLSTCGPGLAELSTANLGRTTTPDSLAYVIHTSGSTGAPKGVLIEHRNVVNYVSWCLEHYTPVGGTGSPLYSSVAFDLPVTSVYPVLLSGQPVTITADDGTPGIDGLIAALEAGGFGTLKLTPSHLAVLNQSLTADGVRLGAGRVIAGGEELVRDMVSTWAEHAPDTVIDNEYGPTETTVGCSWLEGTAGELGTGVLPIGRPFSNTAMRVLDADLNPVPVGVVGELHVGGAQVARGYGGRPDLTAAKFVPDPYAAAPGARMYRTGDLARYRPDGVLEFAGRVDNQVKVRGYRVELGEVEAALHDLAEVGDVAVRVRTGAAGEKELVAYLTPSDVDTADLPARLAEALPAHLVPAAFVTLDTLPLTRNGKVDVAALPLPAASARPHTAPSNAMENILARAWRKVLGRSRVSVTDSFVELGGHSMTVMRVIVTLREEHGLRLTFRDFYQHRTIAELARVIDAGAAEADTAEALDAVVWLRREGTRPPLFCVHPGSAHWFAALAEHLDPDQPVGAFEWPGLTRPCPAPESIDQIAELNLAQLRRIAPTGPYRLLGWCGGSQITTEMVRRLRARGEDVTFMLLDPALDTYERDNMHEIMARFRRAESLLADLAVAPEDDVPAVRQETVEVLEQIVDDGAIDPPIPGDDFWPSRVRVWRELLQTRIDYRHRACPGVLHLLAGDEVADGVHEVALGVDYADYTARWAALAGELRTHRVPGNHLGVLRAPHVAEVARVVTALMADPTAD